MTDLKFVGCGEKLDIPFYKLMILNSDIKKEKLISVSCEINGELNITTNVATYIGCKPIKHKIKMSKNKILLLKHNSILRYNLFIYDKKI